MKVLVSVSSRHGGTHEIGHAVAEGLAACGHEAVETLPDEVGLVSDHDAVVLGTCVYAGRVGVDLKYLLERQGAALRGMPVWLFWSGPVIDDPEHSPVPEDVVDAAHESGARQIQVFGGRVEKDALTVTEKSLLALVNTSPGDHRDLTGAVAWGRRIGEELSREPARA